MRLESMSTCVVSTPANTSATAARFILTAATTPLRHMGRDDPRPRRRLLGGRETFPSIGIQEPSPPGFPGFSDSTTARAGSIPNRWDLFLLGVGVTRYFLGLREYVEKGLAGEPACPKQQQPLYVNIHVNHLWPDTRMGWLGHQSPFVLSPRAAIV